MVGSDNEQWIDSREPYVETFVNVEDNHELYVESSSIY